ncbi:sulfatase-like hydrolase/transferase [bacterium]|nr:sulfatase-like hydrolase/transferase [bacterium]
MSKRPNIVFLLNDHQAYYRHGWDAGPKVQRPNFDRLAADGINFNRAYTAAPLCGPARRSMLTGLFPHTHGELHNDTGHPYDREVYLDTLAAAGYRNLYFGKWHAGPGTAFDHGCEGFNYPSYNNPYTKPEYKQYLADRGLPEPEVHIEQTYSSWQDVPVGPGYRQDADWCNEHAAGILTTPNDTHEAFFLANLACDALRELAASDDDGPFALRVDFWGPHQPYFPTQEFADLYDPETIPEYGNFCDDLHGKPDLYHVEHNLGISEEGRMQIPSAQPWSEWRKTVARAYAQATLVDAAGGRVLDALDALGLADDTLVIWATDHGDGLACHGGHFDKASYLPEEMVRVPMALRFPGRVPAAQRSESLVSLVDLAPTFLDAAGLAFEEPVHGSSLLPLAAGEGAEWREDMLVDSHGHFGHHVARIVYAGRHKYVANQKDLHELYDLEADPFELTNLIDDPAHQSTVADLRARLRGWQERTDDPDVVLK